MRALTVDVPARDDIATFAKAQTCASSSDSGCACPLDTPFARRLLSCEVEAPKHKHRDGSWTRSTTNYPMNVKPTAQRCPERHPLPSARSSRSGCLCYPPIGAALMLASIE